MTTGRLSRGGHTHTPDTHRGGGVRLIRGPLFRTRLPCPVATYTLTEAQVALYTAGYYETPLTVSWFNWHVAIRLSDKLWNWKQSDYPIC